MEIQNFKMRVTPEQSRIVQQTLFNNGYKWKDSSTKVVLEQKTVLCLEYCIKWTDEERFEGNYLPELTFQEFFDRYVKWCVKVTKENREVIYQWKFNDIQYSSYLKPDYYVNSDWSWSPEPYNSRIELTFEQFEKYVLKSKDMEKVIGYKFKKEYESYLKAYCAIVGIIPESASIVDYKETGYVFQSKSIAYDRIKNAGVLDLWFEPVYAENSKELYFGKVKFTIKKGYADTEYGKVTKEEVKNAIDYIENPPKLTGNTLSIHYNSTYCKITELDNNGTLSYGFGCQAGSLKELKAIYNAFE